LSTANSGVPAAWPDGQVTVSGPLALVAGTAATSDMPSPAIETGVTGESWPKATVVPRANPPP
jgi:hypothetical protein